MICDDWQMVYPHCFSAYSCQKCIGSNFSVSINYLHLYKNIDNETTVVVFWPHTVSDSIKMLRHWSHDHISFPAVEEQIKHPTKPEVPEKTEPSVATEQPVAQFSPSVSVPASAVDGVDLSKIGSILNSLNSVMMSTGECWGLFWQQNTGP